MKVSEILKEIPRETLQELLEKSDAKGVLSLLTSYTLISLSFILLYLYPHPLSWLTTLIVLANRQLGLAILMHDAAHGTLFRTSVLNTFFGKWFCAAPVLADLDRYRTYHLEHHRTAGTPQDPDRSNYEDYPVSKKSFLRKVVRDMSGLTGLKILITVIKMNAGLVKYQLSYDKTKKNTKPLLSSQILSVTLGLYPTVIFHSCLLGIFLYIERPEIYFSWWLAWLTFYMLFSRIRNAAEHGATRDIHTDNPLFNTRTTMATPLARMTVAPHFVNYHLEHHILATVPPHNLKKFHHLLSSRNVLNQSSISSGYGAVLRELVN